MSNLFEERNIEDVYDNKDDHTRIRNLILKFKQKFGEEPGFLVRAPGRVNLIGEHVDYCGFPVLPIAIQQDVVIAGRADPSDRVLTVSSSNDSFQEYSCNIRDVQVTEVKWYSYVLAGYLGIAQRINSLPPGLQLMVDGTVPMSAGLSSSSALVCASALMSALFLKEKTLKREAMAEICAKAERYVGTEGGGMDQAISFLGVKGKAQLINFNPVRCEAVSLPDSVTFVVANCMVNKWKADGTDFNNRVAECRLAADVIATKLGLDWNQIEKLQPLMVTKNMTSKELLESVEEHLHPGAYTKEEIMGILGVDDSTFATIIGKSSNEVFRLYDRAVHVAGEASRVAEFRRICDENPADIQGLGRLIDESHLSLKDKYNVSIEELDNLTQICRDAGALGSRLVGAGFGGCTISMVPKEIADQFIAQVWEAYYKPLNVPFEEATSKHLFVSSPCAGACVLKVPS